jgi:LacI family transcriptional regulator
MNIREIARQAGTSYTTVSRALNDSPLIAQKTKERIQQIAKDLGYSIDAGAKSLATGIRMTLGILYPYHNLRKVESLYTNELIHSIREELRLKGFDTMINGYDTVSEDMSEMTRLVRQKKIDGLVIIGHEMNHEALKEISRSTGNILLINPNKDLEAAPCSKILVDHRKGGMLAAQALQDIVPEELLIIKQSTAQFSHRTEGFLSVYGSEAALVTVYDIEEGSYESAYRFISDHIEEVRKFRGIFVQEDRSAFGVMNALQDNRIMIPDDISVVGYDDIQWCEYSRPTLTTIHQPRTDAAVIAAQIMYDYVVNNDPQVRTVSLEPVLRIRDSVRRPRTER